MSKYTVNNLITNTSPNYRGKTMSQNQFETLIETKEINKRVKELSKILDKRYKKDDTVFVCVLKGAVLFYTELIKNLKNKNIELDFIQVKSYEGTESSGQVKVIKDVSVNVTNKNVVLVEDIIDTGITANFLYEHILSKNPKSILMCSLLQKPEKLKVDLKIETLIGFEIPNKFIVGFGLDYYEKLRNENKILILKD